MQKYAEYYALAQQCHDVFDSTAKYATDSKISPNTISEYQHIVATEMQRAWESFLSFCVLYDEGHILDAKSICRKLLETTITLKYLSESPILHSQFFNGFGLLKTHQELERYERYVQTPTVIEPVRQKIKARMDKLDFYPRDRNGRIEARFFNSWSGKTLYEMASDSQALELYVTRAFELNASTHINTIVSREFFSEEHLRYGPPDNQFEAPLLMCEVAHYMFLIAGEVCKAHGFEPPVSHSALERSINELTPRALRIALNQRSESSSKEV